MNRRLLLVAQEGDTQILYHACGPARYATLYFVELRSDKIPIGVYINRSALLSYKNTLWHSGTGREGQFRSLPPPGWSCQVAPITGSVQ